MHLSKNLNRRFLLIVRFFYPHWIWRGKLLKSPDLIHMATGRLRKLQKGRNKQSVLNSSLGNSKHRGLGQNKMCVSVYMKL